jgi:dihydrofolate reductase
VLNQSQKYVTSRKLEEPLPWMNSTPLKGDAEETVAKLKQEEGNDLVVLGSGELVRSLMPAGLVDEYVLLIHPLVPGTGTRLFPDGSRHTLELIDTKTAATGVIIVTYRPGAA